MAGGFSRAGAANAVPFLDRAGKQALLGRDGLGHKSDPFRYWLPGRADMPRPDPGASPEEMQAWNERLMKEYLRRLQAKKKKNAAGERGEIVP
jgi:hypothetical protein